jgi:hypothetical protein
LLHPRRDFCRVNRHGFGLSGKEKAASVGGCV